MKFNPEKFNAEDGGKRRVIRQLVLPRAKNPPAGAPSAPCLLVNDTVSMKHLLSPAASSRGHIALVRSWPNEREPALMTVNSAPALTSMRTSNSCKHDQGVDAAEFSVAFSSSHADNKP
jgi:hypothetical protein